MKAGARIEDINVRRRIRCSSQRLGVYQNQGYRFRGHNAAFQTLVRFYVPNFGHIIQVPALLRALGSIGNTISDHLGPRVNISAPSRTQVEGETMGPYLLEQRSR